jgi:DNA mismatch repair protein MutL
MPIRRLPTLLVNQIAAGEVIERPASVVKELVENALDAGARQIDVTIENGGRDLIRIVDDGKGISADELALAIAPHATSKIIEAVDLNAIATFGFRGEALASIAAVSRMSLLSRTAGSDSAHVIEIEGDVVNGPRPAAGAHGTTVTIRNLFFNTPARRKFLRGDATEAGRATEMVSTMAMAHSAVGFRLRSDDRLMFELAPETSPQERLLEVIGVELREQLGWLHHEEQEVTVWGYVGTPEIARSVSKHVRVFINGRPISDRSILHAIKEAYRGLIEPARYPTVALFLEMPAAMVDVNVHPTKSEVRFRNQGLVHGVVLSSVRRALRAMDLTPGVQVSAANGSELGTGRAAWMSWKPASSGGPSASSDSQRATRDFIDYVKQLDPHQKSAAYSEIKQAIAAEPAPPEAQGFGREHSHEESSLPTIRNVQGVMQVHSSYLVTQDEHGLIIIDQHALHERVMFEKLKERIGKASLESQRLLMPVPITLDETQMELVEELQPLWRRIGIEIEPAGPRSAAIHAFSSFLIHRNVEPAAFMMEVIEKAAQFGANHDSEAALHEVLDMMACKAAVKAGDRLTEQELAELVKHRDLVERSSNCPHGRPTSLRLSLRDLEKQFGRT